jgi:hypothetical protein
MSGRSKVVEEVEQTKKGAKCTANESGSGCRAALDAISAIKDGGLCQQENCGGIE